MKLTFDRNDVDLCVHCGELDGTVHDVDAVPEVPTEGCTSRGGCGCDLDSADDVGDADYEGGISIEIGADAQVVEPGDAADEDPVRRLRQLKQMLAEGLIEQTEYDEKKREILSRL